MQSQIYRNILRLKPIHHQNVNFYSVITSSRYLSKESSHLNNTSNRNNNFNSKKIILPQNLLTKDVNSRINILLQSRSFNVSAATFNSAQVAASSSTEVATEAVGTTEVATEAVGATLAATDSSKELILDFLPEKPIPIDPTEVLGEPTFELLGLGSWWPSGRLQLVMEWLHIGAGMEWYQVIGLTAICLRLISFPFVVMAQRNVAAMTHHTPEMQAIQERVTEARKRGDMLEMTKYSMELQEFMAKNKINPFKNILPVMIQVPLFLSMFFGLKGMANLPVPSMEQGGALWFENLAMMDPFYALPIFTSLSLYAQFKVGVDGNRLETMGAVGKAAMTCIPFIMLPFTMNFPCAVTWYWFVSNTFSIGQTALIRQPFMRKKLGIPAIRQMEKNEKKPKKDFRSTVKDTISD